MSAGWRSLSIGLAAAILFSLVLNTGSLWSLSRGELTIADLGAELHSADEVYYFALIRDVADGNMSLGNASLLEHKGAPSVAGYTLLIQGLLARFTGLDVTLVVLLGDIFFVAAVAFVCFLIARRFARDDLLAALFAVAFMAWWGTGWQRTMNPQVTMLLFLLSLLAIVSGRSFFLRGALLAVLFLMQPIYAVLILAMEGLDALSAAWNARSFSPILRRWPLLVGLLIAAGLQLWLQSSADSDILLDTYRRRGLIESRLPTAPLRQATILLVLLVTYVQSRRLRSREGYLLAVFLLAGFLVLNQSVLHGKDIVFGLYYRHPLSLLLCLSAFWLALTSLPRRPMFLLSIAVAGMVTVQMLDSMISITVPRLRERSASFRASDAPRAIALLPKEGDEVVLAPIEVSNLVPVLSPHHALFTQYAHFEYVSDRELAERYLLLRTLFSLPPEHTVEGEPLVFGIYAGNRYARNKILCRFGFGNDCDRTLADFIPHQDVRRFVEEGTIDIPSLLKKYGVTAVISDRPLPSSVVRGCRETGRAGVYGVYDCAFRL